MGKIEHFTIQFDRATSEYMAGEMLNGRVVLLLSEQIRVSKLSVELNGKGQTNWMNKTSEKVFSCNQTYICETINLLSEGTRTFSVGAHQLSFQILLPPSLPSSITGEFGNIRYWCLAMVTRKKESTFSDSVDYAVEAPLVVTAKVELSEPLLAPFEACDGVYFTRCCCLATGAVTAWLSVLHQGFMRGQPLPVSCKIDNASHKTINNVKVKLMQHVRFYGQSSFLEVEEFKELTALVAEKHRSAIAPRTNQQWDELLSTTIGPNLIPTQTERAVNILYTIRLELDPGPTIEIPVVICSVPASTITFNLTD